MLCFQIGLSHALELVSQKGSTDAGNRRVVLLVPATGLNLMLSDILLDSSNEALVIDCVVLPVEDDACEVASVELCAATEHSTERIIRVFGVNNKISV